MDPPQVLTDLHSTAAATKGPRRRAQLGCLRGTEASADEMGGCLDLNGAECSARTEMERACERMEFCGANEISWARTGRVSGEPDAQRGFTGAILWNNNAAEEQ
jgi:hypothetical protein